MVVLALGAEPAGLDVLALGFDAWALLCIPAEVLSQVGAGCVFGATITFQLASLALPLLAERVHTLTPSTVQMPTQPVAPLTVATDLADIVGLLRESLSARDETIRLQQQQLQQQKTLQEQMRIELVRAGAQLDLLNRDCPLGIPANFSGTMAAHVFDIFLMASIRNSSMKSTLLLGVGYHHEALRPL